MFDFVYGVRYWLIGGFARLFRGGDVVYKFEKYDITYHNDLCTNYPVFIRTLDKKTIDEEVKRFFEGMGTFWLDYTGAAAEFTQYDEQGSFYSNAGSVSFRWLIMYYVDVLNTDMRVYDRRHRHMLRVLRANIYSWLTVVSNSDRRKILNILDDELFGNFKLHQGFDAIVEIKQALDEWDRMI